jgi:hypothetical protein
MEGMMRRLCELFWCLIAFLVVVFWMREDEQ